LWCRRPACTRQPRRLHHKSGNVRRPFALDSFAKTAYQTAHLTPSGGLWRLETLSKVFARLVRAEFAV
jgi:hypothetical protein